jgi:hypothetical protein
MSSRWPGSLINKTAPVSSGGGEGDSAPGIWTLDQANPYIVNQTWPGTGVVDPQFQYVTALLHGDGVNAAQNNTFLDSSINNFTITRNGNTTQGSFSPYGPLWSNYFNGSSYLSMGGQSNFAFGTGDWTVEMWVYLTTTSGNQSIWDTIPTGTGDSTNYMAWQINSGTINYYTSGSGTSIGGGALSVGVWYHVALCKASGSTRMFINGTQTGSTYTDTQNYQISSTQPWIGTNTANSTRYFNGYISNVRVNKGTALYTTNFTPSTTPLTAVSGTQLLTSQANRFLDASTNNFTVTPNGTPQITRFSPFQNLATYQTAKIGGSGYFDGNGDYLNAGNQTNLHLGSGDFTIDSWVYKNDNAAYMTLCGDFALASTNTFQIIGDASGTKIGWYNGANNSFIITSSAVIPLYAWTYIAFVRSGATLSLYINGVLDSTASLSTDYNASTSFYIGHTPELVAGRYWNGYISNFRIIRGTAITPTVPTTPLTAVTNTQLLLNTINGAIYDNAMMNSLETGGNAQISTSVFKYGTGSMYFNGTNSSLVTPISPLVSAWTGNFTVECWVYAPLSQSVNIWTNSTGNSDGFTGGYIYANGSVGMGRFGVNEFTTAVGAVTTNTWTHIAFVGLGGTAYIYVNGVQRASGSQSTYVTTTTKPITLGRSYQTSPTYALGYIDDFRITQGYARYWFNFQPPTAPFPNYGGTLQLTYDPYFEYNTLLLNGEGTNGAQNNTFLDSSTNNFTITRNGTPTQGSFSPYGSLWSNYFNGASSYLTVPYSAGLAFGTGDFCVEFWLFWTGGANENNVIMNNASGGLNIKLSATNPANWALENSYVGQVADFGTAPTKNTWHHIAVTRSSGTLYAFIDGVQVFSGSNSTSFTNTNTWYIGANGYSVSTYYITGYLSNFRIVVGSAIYTSSFTPSTTPLTAIPNTTLLTCQSNRFIDNSANAFAITASGTPQIQRFSPFNPTAPYSTSVIGGSGYFDGTSGQYLTAPANAAFNFGTGDFTIEGWVYPTTTSGVRPIVEIRTSYLNSTGFVLLSQSGATTLNLYTNGNFAGASTNSLITNQWNYVALVRSGNTWTYWINGISSGSFSNSSTQSDGATTGPKIGGSDTSGEVWIGYMSNIRIVKGTAVYTSNFTPPTTPLTAITNTSLLLSNTNAGIPDLAMINNLETVGNAQVSTAQYKYGSSSLYFDGSGDWLSAPPTPQTDFGSGDFTIECWLYRTASGAASDSGIASRGAPSNTNGFVFGYTSSNVLTFNFNYSGAIVTGSTAIPINTWTYVAVTRNGTTFRLFVNGTVDATATSSNSQTTNASDVFYVGRSGFSSDRIVTGYIDDLRITKGLARYVQTFTPPTAALPTY